MKSLLFYSASGFFAFAAAIGVAILFAGLMHWRHSREEGLVQYIFYPVMFVVGLSILLSGRNLDITHPLIDPSVEKNMLVIWASRATSLFIILAASEKIVRHFLNNGNKTRIPTILILSFCAYFFTNIISSGLMGGSSSLSHEYFYAILAGCAALLMSAGEGEMAIRSARNASFAFLVASAAVAFWQPEIVINQSYHGLVPWLNFRYAGLSSHANSLGMLVVVFLLCLWSKPYGNRWLNRAGWLLGLASLLFAQSKTSWIAFIICLSCLVYYRHGDIPGKSFTRSNSLALMAIILLAMLGCCALAFTAMFGGDDIASFFETRAGADLLTLTGRDQIWEVAVDEWRNNPVFGYGLNIWNEEHRQQIGLPWAFNAHNQFYQSLSSSGIAGALGLVFYGMALFGFTLKTRKSSHGLTLALLTLILIRSISEVPLSLSGYAPDLLTHTLLLMLIAAHLQHKRHAGQVTEAMSRGRFVPH